MQPHYGCGLEVGVTLVKEPPFKFPGSAPAIKGIVSRYIDKNRTGACGLGRNRRLLLLHTELVFLSTVCTRRVVWVLFTNMDAVN